MLVVSGMFASEAALTLPQSEPLLMVLKLTSVGSRCADARWPGDVMVAPDLVGAVAVPGEPASCAADMWICDVIIPASTSSRFRLTLAAMAPPVNVAASGVDLVTQ